MRIIKLYQKPNKPEFYKVVRWDNDSILVNYPLDKPHSKRMARWFYFDEIYIDWIRQLSQGEQ